MLIHNLGIWEDKAFSDEYAFLDESDAALTKLVDVNITATLLLLQRLLPAYWAQQRAAAADRFDLGPCLAVAARKWRSAPQSSPSTASPMRCAKASAIAGWR